MVGITSSIASRNQPLNVEVITSNIASRNQPLNMEVITSNIASKQALEYGSNIQILKSQDRKCYGWRYAAAEQPT